MDSLNYGFRLLRREELLSIYLPKFRWMIAIGFS